MAPLGADGFEQAPPSYRNTEGNGCIAVVPFSVCGGHICRLGHISLFALGKFGYAMGKSNNRKREVKSRDGHFVPSAMEELRIRLRNRLEQKGIGQRALAGMTGDNPENVHNWLRPKKPTRMPADFLVRFLMAVPTNPAWLFLGRGDPEPVPASAAERALSVVRSVLDSLETDPERFDRLVSWWEVARGDDVSEMDDGEPRPGEEA